MKWIDSFRAIRSREAIDPTEQTVIDVRHSESANAAPALAKRSSAGTDQDTRLDDDIRQRQISLAIQYAARARGR